MKKNIYFLLAIMMMAMVSTGFVSCSSDDDEGYSNSIVGTWKYAVSEEYDKNGNLVEKHDVRYNHFVQYNEGGTGVEYYQGYRDTFKYSINGKKLTIWYEDESATAEILTLTSTDLALKTSDEDDIYIDRFERVSDSVVEGLKK